MKGYIIWMEDQNSTLTTSSSEVLYNLLRTWFARTWILTTRKLMMTTIGRGVEGDNEDVGCSIIFLFEMGDTKHRGVCSESITWILLP